jgi:hypothetical protein
VPRPVPPRLVACVGVKSPLALLDHFVDHYRRLGVGGFLLVLHAAPGDSRREPMRQRLSELGVEPALEIADYSAARKLAHFRDLVRRHCAPEEWVVYADVDELQAYPADLPSFLEERGRRGRRFVRGHMIDRIGPGGELVEMRVDLPLWQQFPGQVCLTASLTGGWDRKVCAARAAVSLSDGGAHAIDFGLTPGLNYRLTHRWPRRGDPSIEIHHFKWDSTLPDRVSEKLQAAGGDHDAAEGPAYIEEYRRLDRHLREHGRIRLA